MAFTGKDPDDTYLAILNLGDANEVLHATTVKTVLDAAGNASLLALSQDTIEFLGVCNIDVADGIVMDTGIDFESDLIVTSSLVAQADEAVGVLFTSGDPEGSLTAGIGSIALRLDGSTGTTAYVKEVGAGNTGWVAVDSIVNWIDMDDTPVAFSANKWVKVNAGGTALEFVAAPTGAETFVALTDTPANFTSAALKILRVNAGATAVEFVAPFDETFLSLGDTPGAFVASKMLKVNAGNTAVELGDAYVTSSPAQGEVMFYSATGWANLGVGSTGEVLSSGGVGADPTWESTSGVFPSAVQGEIVYYSGAAWLSLAVGTVAQVLTTQGAGANPTWEDVDAFPATPAQGEIVYYNGAAWANLGVGTANKVLTTQGAAANPTWETPSAALPTGAQGEIVYHNGSAWVVLAVGTSGHFLKTQGAAANPVWAAAAGGASAFTDLSATDADYGGAARGLLAVNTGENSIEFVASEPDDNQILVFNDGAGNWEAGRLIITGTGSPESSVNGSPGDFYTRSDGSTTDVLYVKATGSGTNTGWAKVTSAGA